GDRLLRDLLPELRARVQGAVLVVLPRDPRHHVLQGRVLHAVLLPVGRGQQAEGGRRGELGAGAVTGHRLARETRDPRILQLLDADGHRDVVGAGGHRVARVAKRLGAGGAVVLEPAHRLVVDLERARERETRLARVERAEPERVDVRERDARGGERVLRGVDQEVVDALVPVLAERRAPHADDRHPVADPVARHQSCPPPVIASRISILTGRSRARRYALSHGRERGEPGDRGRGLRRVLRRARTRSRPGLPDRSRGRRDHRRGGDGGVRRGRGGGCRRLGRRPPPPVPYLVALVTAANVGSVATLTGNPQNMLVGSFSSISYRSFLAREAPIAVVGLVCVYVAVALVYRRRLPNAPLEIAPDTRLAV